MFFRTPEQSDQARQVSKYSPRNIPQKSQVQILDFWLLSAKIYILRNNKILQMTNQKLTFTAITPTISTIAGVSVHPSNNSSKISAITEITDGELFQLCKTYGKNALLWRRKFIGLLPEVNRRQLYERKGFSSIFEFAARLAGVSREQVKLALNLENRFGDKPILKEALVSGEISINKLAKIASIATIENQECLVEQAKLLPCRTLETLVRDEKLLMAPTVEDNGMILFQNNDIKTGNQNGFLERENEPKSLHVNSNLQHCSGLVKSGKIDTVNSPELKLSDAVTERLQELQRRGIDVNQLLMEFLDKRAEEIEQEKEEIAEELNQSDSRKSKYIKVKIRKIIHREHGTKCSMPTCDKPAVELHHTLRFSLYQSHDPRYIAPLCHDHHLIAHSIDRRFREKRAESG